MSYTVKQLAKLSGVSIRTLHFYDEVGLLKPAYYGSENNYRYYEEEQLLLLQQILFYREMGFALADIGNIMGSNDFDKIKALHSHKIILKQNINQTKKLINTIDKTLAYLRGETMMQDKEMYYGFDSEKQKGYEEYLINNFGDQARSSIATTKNKMKSWSKSDWEKFTKDWDAICEDLAALLQKNAKPDSDEVQAVISRHFKWLPWTETCTKEAYIGLGQGYTGFEWQKAFTPYDQHHPYLAKFMAEAMKLFAESKLS